MHLRSVGSTSHLLLIPTLDPSSVTFFSTGCPSGSPVPILVNFYSDFVYFPHRANIREIGGKVEKNLTGTLLFSRIG